MARPIRELVRSSGAASSGISRLQLVRNPDMEAMAADKAHMVIDRTHNDFALVKVFFIIILQ